MKKIAYVAHDHGPRATLEALAVHLPGDWSSRGADVLICGTSDSCGGREIEAHARKAARARGTSVVVIEDFPGNYVAVPDGEPQLLVVESEFAALLARAKDKAVAIEICPCVRYDALRRRLPDLRKEAGHTKAAVLWVGQPETRDSLETLQQLMPELTARGMAVWFRAHPRDEGYRADAYGGLCFEDVTALSLDECLSMRPRLVVTQFSSVAVEAGFWGICGLNVLFPDLGARTLVQRKGYAVPPWCEAGAAFVISREKDVPEVLDRAFDSREARASVMAAFDRYYCVAEDGGQRLMKNLYNHGLL